MPGIKDIAKKAGCSISTVSYALNGSTKVTEQTRSRILQIANELEYVPNAAARMLRSRETKIIGCFLSDYSGSFYGRLLKGIRETLNAQGYELIVCSGEKSRRLLLEKMMDGAIILDEAFTHDDLLQYAHLGHKMVLLDRELKHENIATVLLDNEKGAELAVLELVEKGIEKLYLVKGPKGSYDAQQRLLTARKVANDQLLQLVEFDGDFTKEAGLRSAVAIADMEDKKPVGVFCLNDEMAIGFHDHVSETSKKIGEDLYLVGFDNTELASYMMPKLTTIDYSTTKWGRIATEHLLKLLKDEQTQPEKINVKLTKGGSC